MPEYVVSDINCVYLDVWVIVHAFIMYLVVENDKSLKSILLYREQNAQQMPNVKKLWSEDPYVVRQSSASWGWSINQDQYVQRVSSKNSL